MKKICSKIKKQVLFLLTVAYLIILLSSLSLAEDNISLSQELPEQLPASEVQLLQTELTSEVTNEVVASFADIIKPLLKSLSVVVGGIFGLYLIIILARIHYERKKVKLLQNILYDLDRLNEYYKIPNSKMRKGPLQKLVRKILHKVR